MLRAATGIKFLVELKDEAALISTNRLLRIIALKAEVNLELASCYYSADVN